MNDRRKQRGAVLIIGMILLLVITLLSVNVMSVNSLELKIADNSTEKVVSFEAAESATKSAKQAADTIAASLNTDPTVFPGSPSAGVYNVGGPGTNVFPPDVGDKAFWADSDKYAGSGSSMYVVEYLGKQAMELDSNRNTGTTTDLHVFRLTMRGSGGVSGNTAIQAVYVTN